MKFRKATKEDIKRIAELYESVHDAKEKGLVTCDWARGVYPVEATAAAGVERGDMFVCEENDQLLAAAILNQLQVDCYVQGNWDVDAPADQVMVIHTLAVEPSSVRKGIGTAFVKFYEAYALERNWPYLRMDTGEVNTIARSLYKKLGYKEIGMIPTIFNGIPGVNLVLLEKTLR